MLRFPAKSEYDRLLRDEEQLFAARWLWGHSLREATRDCGYISGWCALCGRATRFCYATGQTGEVNLREELQCSHCKMNARNRIAMQLGFAAVPDRSAQVYATEQASSMFRRLVDHYPGAIGSEFYTEESEPRLSHYLRMLFGDDARLRFEDATRLNLHDAEFDLVMTSDVLEHVPDYRAALAEFARILKPGGHLVLTVPFLNSDQRSIKRAELRRDGSIEHLVEPEYHGDPVSPEGGVLAFHSFGWDLLDAVRAAGFWSAHWCLPWDPAQAIFTGSWLVHAKR